jgi:hypothetical protein
MPPARQSPQWPTTVRAVLLGLAAAVLVFFGLAAYGMFDATSDNPGSRLVPTPWGIFGLAAATGSAVALFASRRRTP